MYLYWSIKMTDGNDRLVNFAQTGIREVALPWLTAGGLWCFSATWGISTAGVWCVSLSQGYWGVSWERTCFSFSWHWGIAELFAFLLDIKICNQLASTCVKNRLLVEEVFQTSKILTKYSEIVTVLSFVFGCIKTCGRQWALLEKTGFLLSYSSPARTKQTKKTPISLPTYGGKAAKQAWENTDDKESFFFLHTQKILLSFLCSQNECMKLNQCD